MFDRLNWQEPKEQSRSLNTKLQFTIDLGDKRPGERHPFEQAMRTIFPSGWTRKDARIVIEQAIKAVSHAIIADGSAAFPLQAMMLRGPRRSKLDEHSRHVITVHLRRGCRPD